MLEFLSITGFILLVAMAPGADFAIIVRNSLLYPRGQAVATALGIGASLIVHTTYSLAGLAIAISKSLMLFTIIKYVGAAYLTWLGIKTILEKNKTQEDFSSPDYTPITMAQAFGQGFLCNLLNPKAPIFFIAFYSVIIPAKSAFSTKLFYGAESVLVITAWFVALSMAITWPVVKNHISKAQNYISKALGGVMVFFGIRLAFLSR